MSLILSKKDIERNSDTPSGGAKLEGAEYTVKYYDTISTTDPASSGMTPKKTWVFKTNSRGYIYLNDSFKVGGDDLPTMNGIPVLLLGTYTFQETKAPEGYFLDNGVYVANTSMDEDHQIVHTTNLPTDATASKEQVYRGDLRIRKTDGESGETMGNIPFKITSLETGESHTIVTDENGEYNTASSFVAHSNNTNAGIAEAGVWFTGESTGTKAPVNDAKGALPYGRYKIEELPCAANQGYIMFSDTFKCIKTKIYCYK